MAQADTARWLPRLRRGPDFWWLALPTITPVFTDRLPWDCPFLGGLEWLYRIPPETYAIALAVGDNYARMAVAQSLISHHIEVATVCSPSAIIAPSARVGRGTVVMPRVVLNPDAVVGEGAILNTGAIVEHDVAIGHYAHVSPNTVLGGGAMVGDLAHIAISATVLPFVRIGSRSVLGAGSVAVRDIPAGVVAFGSSGARPAK